jgi:hypothetical protein
MRSKSNEQSRIDRKLTARKKWLIANEPFCIFCGHHVSACELAHLIRRSYASSYHTREELQTNPLNNGLAHHECHVIFDDKPNERKSLPFIENVMIRIETLDIDYYRRMFSE